MLVYFVFNELQSYGEPICKDLVLARYVVNHNDIGLIDILVICTLEYIRTTKSIYINDMIIYWQNQPKIIQQ